MSKLILDELKGFLKSVNLSNYEINTYMILLISNPLRAREISERSGVPIGRIYDILEKLKEKGLIEIQESRPKMYKSMPFNFAFQNIIAHIITQNQRKISNLYETARILESKVFNSDLLIRQETSKTFWSTEFNINSILALYIRNVRELKEELLISSFVNRRILSIIRYAKNYFLEILKALNRGVQVKYLWSPELGNRFLVNSQIDKNQIIFKKLKKEIKELFGLSTDIEGFEIKYVPKIIPTHFIIFDKKRVIIKMQNPLRTSEIFATMNVLDPNLAMELREIFLNIWFFDVID